MIARSDESIRLQNEVFVRTTDALQRIESSTGVTEKRIEDMISGQAGLISQRVADRAVTDKLVSDRGSKQFERDIRDIIRDELSTELEHDAGETKAERAAQRAMTRARYVEFKGAVLLELANTPEVRAQKLGNGAYGRSGDGLVDGIFTADGVRFGISTFPTEEMFAEEWEEGFSEYVQSLAEEIAEGTFGAVFLAFDGEISEETGFGRELTGCLGLMREELAQKLHMVSGTPEQVHAGIVRIIGDARTSG